MRPDFAPRGIGVIIDDAVELYRRNWKTLMAVALMIVGPAALAMSVAQVFYFRGYVELFPLLAEGDPAAFGDSFGSLLIPSMVVQLVWPLYWAAVNYVTACVYASAPAMQAGVPVSVRGSLAAGLKVWPWFLLVSILVGLAVGVGNLALLVPGIVLAVRWSLVPAVAAVEGAGIDSLRRSWRLTGTTWVRVIGFFICMGIINFAVQGALNSPAAVRQLVDSVQDPNAVFQELSIGWKVFEGLLSAASISLALPLTTLAWYFFYVDMRARAEGLDLLVRARGLAGAAGGAESA